MSSPIDDIAGLLCRLTIAPDAPQDREQDPLRSACSHPTLLQDAIHRLAQSTNAIKSDAQSVQSLANNANACNLPITEACSLHETAKKLTKITLNLQTTVDALHEVAERSIIIRLKSLGSRDAPDCSPLFSYFEKGIRSIIREVLNNTNHEEVLWKVAEDCYNQVTSSSGVLRARDYFNSLKHTFPGRDSESEEHSGHENRLAVDKNAAAFPKQNRESETRDSQGWTDFWVRVLHHSPQGPTLFYPPASLNTQSRSLDAVPRYLFRVFDEASSGRNDESVIASAASISVPQRNSRTDLLTLDKDTAAWLLHMHLDKSCFDADESDNLMSWTSSLLFAIQYAVWRVNTRGCSPSDITLCAVDTRDFPQGQFAHDVWLLGEYRANAERLGGEIHSFFNFRLGRDDYYNGEYLSQGTVNHKGRSCLVFLEDLIQARLYELYPEFGHPSGGEKWTKRVLELRQHWSPEQRTTDQEIQLALSVAHNCFTRFEPFDIASILLTFKNRRFTMRRSQSSLVQFMQQPEWAEKPAEVHRYWIASEAVKPGDKSPQALREIFY